MVAAEYDSSESAAWFVLRPDFGGHWRQTVWLYATLVATSMSVALVFAFMGFWPILPFAGLELAALGAALYASARRGAVREVVWVDKTQVVVERGRYRPESRQTFDRYWSVVELSWSPQRWYPSQLAIRSGTRRLRLGEFLQDEERQKLARELGELIGPMASAGGDTQSKDVPALGA